MITTQHCEQEEEASNEIFLICGSFFIMQDVRKALGITGEACDPAFVNKSNWFEVSKNLLELNLTEN